VVVDAEVNETNKTTPRSARRSVLEKSLTGPTLLEMSGFRPGALLLRIIQIGNTRSRTLADNLGEIELPASGIGSGDEQTAYRVDRSTEESAMTKGVTRYLGPC